MKARWVIGLLLFYGAAFLISFWIGTQLPSGWRFGSRKAALLQTQDEVNAVFVQYCNTSAEAMK